ncbi:MAG TPA: PspA/IM30 family protein [Gammaproteobacteria bacterium]|nr:PspA/IM30 family protein [Gammaproteobacteria bacterium]
MSLMNKIFTAIRGGAREAGEAIVDANSIRILEQEIKDAEAHISKAKQDLTTVMAKEMQSNREIERLKKQIEEYEGYALEALNKGNEALATEIAEKIASLEPDLAIQEETKASFSAHAHRLKSLVKKTERQLAEHKRQLVMVKTTDSVQKATSAISDNFTSSNSRMMSATDSLQRIKQKQKDFDDKLKAAEMLEDENTDSSLEAKMKQAGIGKKSSSASSVLDRIKTRKGA